MVGIGLKIKMCCSLLALSTHKNVKCYPAMTKGWFYQVSGLSIEPKSAKGARTKILSKPV